MKTSFLALVPLIALLGCSKNPAENVTAANVSTATNAATAAPAAAKTFAFGPDSSAVEFVGSKVTGSHKGGFKKFAGELNVENGALAGAGNKVVVEIGSLWADNDRVASHLKSPDFFDVAKFPTATFVTTTIEKQATNSIVTGNLTMHGVTKQISFPADIKVGDDAVDLVAEFFVNRFDFDIKYAGKADDLVRKEVVLKLKVSAKPTKPATPSAG